MNGLFPRYLIVPKEAHLWTIQSLTAVHINTKKLLHIFDTGFYLMQLDYGILSFQKCRTAKVEILLENFCMVSTLFQVDPVI